MTNVLVRVVVGVLFCGASSLAAFAQTYRVDFSRKFGYPKGVLMPGGYAPACRVGAFWSGEAPASFTNEGWQLFDAAVTWATRAACR